MQLSEKNKKDFNEIFSLIDLGLSASNARISERPFFAACEFVEKFVIDIKGDTKDKYYTKGWFKDLYEYSVEWYDKKYGSALYSKSKNYIKGVVLIYHTPFEIHVPETIVKKDEDGIHKWITLPGEVFPEEDILSWIINPPNIEKNSEQIVDQIKEVGAAIRSIKLGLMTATSDNENIAGMKSNIINHLESAADDILSNKLDGVSMVYWEIQMALEKILKVFLLQRGEPNPYNHKIKEMITLICDKYKVKIDDNLLKNIPSNKEAIQYRYGEIPGTTPQFAYGIYKNSLQIISLYTNELKRSLIMKNASFKIAPPPWMEL